MPKIPFLAWIFQVIPESIAYASLVMVLGTGKLNWNKIIKIGFIQAVFIYLIRLMPFTPGVHVIILATTLGFLAISIGGLEMKRALVLSAICGAILVLVEFVVNFSLISLKIITIEELSSILLFRILGGYPQIIVLFLLTALVHKRKINLSFLFNKN